jgi:hypothetical protein
MRRILIPILGVFFSLVSSRAMAASLESTNEVKAAIKNIQVGPGRISWSTIWTPVRSKLPSNSVAKSL